MTGKEILFKAIQNELTPRPAWVSFVGVHGAHLIGVSAEKYLKSQDLMFKDMEHFACDLPDDYSAESNVVVDIVTLDSASCAPCGYMVGAVNKAASHLSKPVQVKEHRISSREGLAAMKKLGVQNIPTICIDGRVAFASIIPDQKRLIARIEEAIAKKG